MKDQKKNEKEQKKIIDKLYKDLVEKHKIQSGAYFINAHPTANSRKPFIK